MRRVSRWLALDRRSGRVAGLPTVEVVAAEDYDREVNDLRDQVQMYEEKAERDWRDFGEMQDARIAADDRVAQLLRESDVMEGEWLERTAQLVEALSLIRAHARLDLSQRGIAEAERYAAIADDALTARDLLASSTAEKLASPRKRSASASDPAAAGRRECGR